MYEWIEGTLRSISPTYIVIQAGGIAYKVLCANPFAWQDQMGQSVTCYVELVVREDSMTLYGFKDVSEKQLFLTLNKVSGIGPKSALSILAADDHDGLIHAIQTGNSQYLTKFPGVGKKTAQQMILDLKGELAQEPVKQTATVTQTSPIIEEVCAALLGLGYSAKEIKKVEPQLTSQTFATTQAALSYALKLLLK